MRYVNPLSLANIAKARAVKVAHFDIRCKGMADTIGTHSVHIYVAVRDKAARHQGKAFDVAIELAAGRQRVFISTVGHPAIEEHDKLLQMREKSDVDS